MEGSSISTTRASNSARDLRLEALSIRCASSFSVTALRAERTAKTLSIRPTVRISTPNTINSLFRSEKRYLFRLPITHSALSIELCVCGGGVLYFFHPFCQSSFFYVNLPYILGKSLQATENLILYILYHKKKESTRKNCTIFLRLQWTEYKKRHTSVSAFKITLSIIYRPIFNRSCMLIKSCTDSNNLLSPRMVLSGIVLLVYLCDCIFCRAIAV